MKRLIRASASEAVVNFDNKDQVIASEIALNIKGEWDAIEGYQKLIPWLEEWGSKEDVDQVKEIISDELNHAEVLREMMAKYDGNIPTNET